MIIKFNGSHSEIFNFCIEAMKRLNYNVIYSNIGSGKIMFKPDWSIWSLVEPMQIIVIEDSIGIIRIEISSKVTPKAQLSHWGRDDENVNLIISLLTELTGQQPYIR